MTPRPLEPEKPLPLHAKFILGGLAGMMSISLVQPADLVKTRMQLAGIQGKSELGFMTTTKNIVRMEGYMGLYTGLSAAVLRQGTYGTARLGCFYTMIDWYSEKYKQPPTFTAKLLMGMIAGGLGAFIGTPSEVALIRMTADGSLPPEKQWRYRHVFNALNRIGHEEGITVLWRGAASTITRAMVVNAAELGSYAQAREMLLPSLGDGIGLHFVASMISGFVTSFVSLPVDIIKTRVQNAKQGESQIKILRSILKNEGFLALWSGFWPTYAKIGPLTVFIFVILEQLNILYRKYVQD